MRHKSVRWGLLLTQGATPEAEGVPLQWLPDVVEHCTKTRPPAQALQHICQRLSARHGLTLYVLQRDRWARPVTDADVWQNARTAEPARWGWVDNRINPDGTLKQSVLEGREPETVRKPLPAQEAELELRGVPGAFTWLTEVFRGDVRRLHDFSAGRLAILASDAAELFGYGVEVAQQPVQAPAPAAPALHLVDAKPAPTPAPAAPAMADELPTKRRKAVARWRELGDIKGVRKKVGDEFGCSERQFTRWIDIVQKEEAAARAEGAFNAGLSQLKTS